VESLTETLRNPLPFPCNAVRLGGKIEGLLNWHLFRGRNKNLQTLGVNFINVLRTAFTLIGPKSVKRYWRLDWVLTLWGTTGVKAVRRTLMKSSPALCLSDKSNLSEKKVNETNFRRFLIFNFFVNAKDDFNFNNFMLLLLLVLLCCWCCCFNEIECKWKNGQVQ